MALFGGKKKVVLSGMLGNGLEWYDYALYGQLSFVFAKIFFPSDDLSISLIMTYLTFAVGFVFRPLGAVIFGRIGDKYGRKKALSASMILMAAATGGLGLLPTYESIGFAAPLLLILIRILQGLSLGGEFSGSMSYVVEHAPADKRATMGSTTVLSLVIGFLMGSLMATLVSASMSTEAFYDWGWRLLFFIGVFIGFIGYYIRQHVEESPAYEEAKASGNLSTRPVRDAFTKYRVKMFEGFSMYLFVTIPFYAIAIYMIGYSKIHLGLTQSERGAARLAH
jgi:MHS family proline/betaine transporter-like MFS transporter